jgi:hypothetical protein
MKEVFPRIRRWQRASVQRRNKVWFRSLSWDDISVKPRKPPTIKPAHGVPRAALAVPARAGHMAWAAQAPHATLRAP